MIAIYVLINIGWIFVWRYFAQREIDLRLTEIICDMSPYLGITLALVAVSYLLTTGIENLYLSFIIKGCLLLLATV